MRAIALLALSATALFGQSTENAVPDQSGAIQHAIQGLGRTSLGLQKDLRAGLLRPPAAPAHPEAMDRACVVPLLEAPVNDQNFPIRRVQPLVTDDMKRAHVLPVCPIR